MLNSEGQVEMDAVIMDGSDLRAGAVACVQNIAHPVSLARMVMEKVGTKYSTPSLTGQDGHGKGWYEI